MELSANYGNATSHPEQWSENSFTTEYSAQGDNCVASAGQENVSSLGEASVWIWRTCPPVLIVLGTFGNVMTIVVLRRLSARHSPVSMSVYLHALAVSDLCLLYMGLLRRWLQYELNRHLANYHDILCKVPMFLSYVCSMTSAYLLVAMTVQRMISVLYPHRASLMCTRKRSIIVIGCIACLSLVINSVVLFSLQLREFWHNGQIFSVKNPDITDHLDVTLTIFSTVSPGTGPSLPTTHSSEGCSGEEWVNFPVCSVTTNKDVWFYYIYIQPWVDLIGASLLPFFVLVLSNAVLVWKVTQAARASRNLTGPTSSQDKVRDRKVSSMALTLIIVSAAFLILTSPLCIKTLMIPAIFDFNDGDTLSWAVYINLFYSNACINFYLYCLSGSKFRNEFKAMFRFERSRPCRAVTVATVSVTHI